MRSDWQFAPEWQATSQLNWVGSREREFTDLRDDVDDYMIFNLGLQYGDRTLPWSVAFQIQNLFDEDAREPANSTIPDDFALPGRAFYTQLQYYFDHNIPTH